jgi:hypothetical protein
MSTTRPKERNAAVFVGAVLSALCSLILVTPVLRAGAVQEVDPDEAVARSNRPLTAEEVGELAALIRKDRYVALVSFRSDFGPPEEVVPGARFAPKTRLVDMTHFHVEGKFSLVSKIYLAPPALGPVSGDAAVNMGWGGDAAYDRVRPLNADWAFSDTAQTMLTVQIDKDKGVLENGFFGPLTPGDEKGLDEFVTYVLAHPYDKITRTEAEALAGQSNPWLCLLSLARLKTLQVHSPKAYGEAMHRVPAEYVPAIMWDLVFNTGFFEEAERQNLVRQLAAYLATADSSHQVAMLRSLIFHVKSGRMDKELIQELKRPDFVGALRKQAEAKSGQKEWTDVVPRYRALADLLEKTDKGKGPPPK